MIRPASIPSPSDGTFEIGPLSIHAYGLMIALGVVAGVWLLGRRLEARGAGTRDDASAIGMWGVIAGIIGARLYHVATSWDAFADDPGRIIQIWKGGLGIPGGLLAGTLAAMWAARRRKVAILPLLDSAAPAVPLSQAIAPFSVTTPQMRPALVSTPRTAQPSSTMPPARRTCAVIAGTAFCGSARPSVGVYSAPLVGTASPGYSPRTSASEIMRLST